MGDGTHPRESPLSDSQTIFTLRLYHAHAVQIGHGLWSLEGYEVQ
jgi:hypothetical protein